MRALIFSGILLLSCLGAVVGWQMDVWRMDRLRAQSAQQTVQQLDIEITRLKFFPKVLAADPRLTQALQRPSQQAIGEAQDLLDLVRVQTDSARVFALNRLGVAVVASPPDARFVGTSHRRRPFYEVAVSGDFGSFFGIDPLTQTPAYYLAHQVTDLQTGAFLGAVAVQINLDTRQSTWRPEGTDFLVLDEFGVAIVAAPPSLGFTAWAPQGQEAKQVARAQQRYPRQDLKGWTHSGNANRLNGQTYVSASAALDFEPWRVQILSASFDVALSHLYASALGLALSFALVAATAYMVQQRRFANNLAERIESKSEELRAAQAALVSKETLAALGRISAAMSHELSQPIARMGFDIRTLQRAFDQGKEGEARTLMSHIRATLAQAARLLESLTLFARRHEAEKEALDLSALVTRTLARIRGERPTTAKHIQTDGLAPDLRVWGNPQLLGQVLINLLTNALAAVQGTPTPQIRIDVQAIAGHAHLSVTDNGHGLDRLQADEIFDPLRSGKPLGEGMGMGLHFSRQVVEEMGGTIRLNQDWPHQGCQFLVTLPLCPDPLTRKDRSDATAAD